MGCDIHLFCEKKVYKYGDKERKDGVWVSLDKWVWDTDYENAKIPEWPKNFYWPVAMLVPYREGFYTHGRNYNLFTALCGVRSNNFVGVSEQLSEEPKGLPEDTCLPIRVTAERWDSDGHSHSWNTLRELQEFDWSPYGDTCDDFKEEVTVKMAYHMNKDDTPDDIRIVYFFDN